MRTTTAKAIIIASKKGYRVDDNGDVVFKNKKRKLYLNRDGYYSFKIRIKINNESILWTVFVHRLAAYQKYGNKIFNNNIQVRHLDSNSTNNKKNNIGFGSISDNNLDKPKIIRVKMALNASSYIKIHNHEEIIRLHKEGMSYKKIMEKLGISSKGTISWIIKKSFAGVA